MQAVKKEPKNEADKFEKLIKEYNCTKWNSLPKFIKRRVEALKKIRLEQVEIQQRFHKELHELELKYEKFYAPLYEKRSKIVSGEYEPTDDECQLPDNLNMSKQNGDQENIEEDFSKEVSFTEEEEKNLKAKVKGIPGFWLGCFSSTYTFNDTVEQHDRPILRYLKDIKLTYGSQDEFTTYKLDFYFDENPYFTNKVLSKTYYLKSSADEKDPFSYEGYEVCKSTGCDIAWAAGKDPTIKTITVKQKNKKDGRMREKTREIERESFFHFFKPPQEPEAEEGSEVDEDMRSLMAVDFELGEIIRQSILPNAPLYYDGYMMDSEDSEDDEDDDEDDSDDMDDDSESDQEGVYSDEEEQEDDESNDSLNASLVKKNSK